jgi:lipopolysaccharide export system permease protein
MKTPAHSGITATELREPSPPGEAPAGHVSAPGAGSDRSPEPPSSPREPVHPTAVLLWLPRRLLRLFVPRLVDRYVLGELIPPLVFGWTLFIVLFVFSLNVFKLAQLAARGARLEAVTELLVLQVVMASVYCLPMAMLLAGLMAFGRLSGDSEIVATQAGGIPNTRLIRNALILGLLVSIGGLALNEHVLPPAGKRMRFLQEQVRAELEAGLMEDLTDQKAVVIQDFDDGKLARLVAARRYEHGPPAILRDVTLVQYQDGEWNTIISAAWAEWVDPSRNPGAVPGENIWRFHESEMQVRSAIVSDYRATWKQKQDLELRLNKNPDQVARDRKNADQMTYNELGAYIHDLKAQNLGGRVVRELEVERERKLAVPFTALIFALVGAPLGIRKQRSTAGVGIGFSLLIIILYYMGMSFLSVLGQNGQIPPLAAAWGCNAVGLAAGFLFISQTS